MKVTYKQLKAIIKLMTTMPKKYCQMFHGYLQKRLDCPMTYSYTYVVL